MKYCSGCGKELKNEAVICPHCGCIVSPALAGRIMRDDGKSRIRGAGSPSMPSYPATITENRAEALCGASALFSLLYSYFILFC